MISFKRTLRKDVRYAIGALDIDGHSLEFNAEWTELRLDVSLAERELRDVSNMTRVNRWGVHVERNCRKSAPIRNIFRSVLLGETMPN